MVSPEVLQELNMSPQQAKLYMAVLEMAPVSVADLAKKTGIERTACYPHLDELVGQSLLRLNFQKGKRLYSAGSPKKIGHILDHKKETFNQILPELLSLYNDKAVQPRVRYYEGQEGMRTIMLHSIAEDVKEKMHLNPLSHELEVLGAEFARRYTETRVQRGIKVYALRLRERNIEHAPWELRSTDESLLREIRYLPNDFKLHDFVIIYNNIVAIIGSKAEDYGLEIESKDLADTMGSFFKMVWNCAAVGEPENKDMVDGGWSLD